MMVPILPGALWLVAAAVLLLLLFVIFGFHLYQRSRLAALARDSATLGQLAAQKEQLAADVEILRASLQSQKEELLKLEAQRQNQELMRVELAQLERKLEERKRENSSSLKQGAELDLVVSRKRNLLSRLEAEIKTLEERRKSMEALRQEMNNVESSLEQGRIRLAVLADQELKGARLKRQLENLEDEQERLQAELEPMRQEKQRLHQFITQARQVAAVKNEQILDQTTQLRQLELAIADLNSQFREKRIEKSHLDASVEASQAELKSAEEKRSVKIEELAANLAKVRQEAELARIEAGSEKMRLQELRENLEELSLTIARLEARKSMLEEAGVDLGSERSKYARKVRAKPVAHVRRKGEKKLEDRSRQVFAPLGIGEE